MDSLSREAIQRVWTCPLGQLFHTGWINQGMTSSGGWSQQLAVSGCHSVQELAAFLCQLRSATHHLLWLNPRGLCILAFSTVTLRTVEKTQWTLRIGRSAQSGPVLRQCPRCPLFCIPNVPTQFDSDFITQPYLGSCKHDSFNYVPANLLNHIP